MSPYRYYRPTERQPEVPCTYCGSQTSLACGCGVPLCSAHGSECISCFARSFASPITSPAKARAAIDGALFWTMFRLDPYETMRLIAQRLKKEKR